jgi:deoxycytidine triphosphate deaminase
VILNDANIKSRELVRNAVESSYRPAAYDLTVGSIITSEGEVVEEHALEPQGLVKVISTESVDIPPEITGYVHVKTSLCNEGVLALNIGIVDPCFSGPLQSTLVNFGKITHRIKKGSVFGRITFHEQMKPNKVEKVVRSMERVREDAQRDVDRYLGPDFLNFSKTVKAAAKEATSEYRNVLLWFAPVLAILLAAFTLFLNFGNMWRLEHYLDVKGRATEISQMGELMAKMSEMEKNRQELEQEIAGLREQLSQKAEQPADAAPRQRR